jgi:hypothetical protein
MRVRASGEHKQRILIQITVDGLKIKDEKSGVTVIAFNELQVFKFDRKSLSRSTFCAQKILIFLSKKKDFFQIIIDIVRFNIEGYFVQ